MTSVSHHTAGLTVVADRPIPGLAVRGSGPPGDLTLHIGHAPAWAASPFLPVQASFEFTGQPQLIVSRCADGHRFAYPDATTFWIDAAAEQVWMTWQTTFEDAATYFVGPIMAFVLRQRGELALHASAVQINNGAVAFVGPHGAGKSTTAAALARRGCAVLTDDLLRVTEDGDRWLAHPYGTMLRLWPDGGALVFGSTDPLERITPTWDKRGVRLGGSGVARADTPVPLTTLVFLTRADDDANGCTSAPLTPSDAMLRLIAHTSASHLLDGRGRAAEFPLIARLARSVPCLQLTTGSGPAVFESIASRFLRVD